MPLENILFSASNNAHLHALNIFLQTPQAANKLCICLICRNSISPPFIAMVMKTMIDSGCCHLSFAHSFLTLTPNRMHVRFPKTPYPFSSNLETFWVNSHLAFSHSLIRFMIGVLHYLPLRDLLLQGTGLSRTMWSKLLSSLTFSQLANLKLNCTCLMKTTLDFLRHHFTLHRLTLPSFGNVMQKHVARYPSIYLSSLSHLTGPPAYMSALIRHFQNTKAVQSLSVTLTAAHTISPFISQVLSTTRHFENLIHLEITFWSSESIAKESFPFPDCERCVSYVVN